MKLKEIKNILIALNSTNNFGDKYPFGNKELTEKVKILENQGKIVFDLVFNKWKLVK